MIAKVLLPVAVVVLLAGAFSAMWALLGQGNERGDRDLYCRRTCDRPRARRPRP